MIYIVILTILEKLINQISISTNLSIFATYTFTDFSNYTVSHWCYGKKELNKNILTTLELDNQILDLQFPKINKIKK